MRSIAVSIASSAQQYFSVGNQDSFPRAVVVEEVVGTMDQHGGAVDLLASAATGARRRTAESL